MRTKTQYIQIIIALLLAAIVNLGGCASTNEIGRSGKPNAEIRTVELNIQQTIAQVESTEESLQELMSLGQVDLKRAYDSYAANVAQMDTLAAQLDNHSNRINSAGKDYFAVWERQGGIYTNPDIKGLNEERRSALSEIFAQIPQANVGVGSALHAYMSYILETQMYLSRHITHKGIETIAPVAQKGIRNGEELIEELNAVLAVVDQVNVEMAQIIKVQAATN